ncbi:MAG: hypothetical protein K2O03_06890 [Lachnospiraceae bacterium]|nr:hypothetical protein [Lachnospiraceae bacterium]
MRKFKNQFAAVVAAAMTGVMAFGLVATAAPAVSVYAEGGTESGSPSTGTNESGVEAEVRYDSMSLLVTTSDPYFTVDVLKDAGDKTKVSKSYTYAAVAKTTEGGGTPASAKSGNTVAIDLGFLKIKKANTLNIYGSSSEQAKGFIVTVAAQPTKEKLKVDATKDTLMQALGKKDDDAKDYQWSSTLGGFWAPIETFDYTSAKVAGTTILLRLAADDGEDKTKNAPAGPEAKIKIPAAAKAPKVTVDYAKDSIKVTDKMEIALLGTAPVDEKTGWTDAKKGMTRDEIATAVLGADATDAKKAEAFKIVVRTAATEKKSASMPVIVEIKGAPVLAADASSKDTATVTIDEKESTIKAEKTDDGVKFTVTGDAKFQYDKGSNKWVDIKNGDVVTKLSGDVTVRIASEKEDKKVAGSGKFGSNSIKLTPAEKKTEESGDKEPTE